MMLMMATKIEGEVVEWCMTGWWSLMEVRWVLKFNVLVL